MGDEEGPGTTKAPDERSLRVHADHPSIYSGRLPAP